MSRRRTSSPLSSSIKSFSEKVEAISLEDANLRSIVDTTLRETRTRIRAHIIKVMIEENYEHVLKVLDSYPEEAREVILKYGCLDIAQKAIESLKKEMIKNGEIGREEREQWQKIKQRRPYYSSPRSPANKGRMIRKSPSSVIVRLRSPSPSSRKRTMTMSTRRL